jgi:hypothetical protein
VTFTQPSADDQQNQDQQPAGTGVHSSWDQVLEMFPEGAQRDALVNQIKEQERNASTAIQKASEAQAPEEWRGLIDEAKKIGLTPEELSESYNQFETMREQIASDPDGWLEGMRSEIDEAVTRGDITRKQGTQLKKDAAAQAAAGGDDDLANLEDPKVAELQRRIDAQDAWRQQQEEAEQQRREEEQEQLNQQEVEQQTQHFMQVFEGAFNNDPVLKDVEPETRYIVANHALNLMDANPNLDEQAATTEAINQFRTRFGLGGGPAQQQPGVPIGRGSNQQVQGQQQQQFGTGRDADKAREKAMVEEAMRQAAAGIV